MSAQTIFVLWGLKISPFYFRLYLLQWQFFLFFFMATPMAYVGSWVGGQITAAAAGYATVTSRATADPSSICDMCHCLWQHWVLNPLNHNGHSFSRTFLSLQTESFTGFTGFTASHGHPRDWTDRFVEVACLVASSAR